MTIIELKQKDIKRVRDELLEKQNYICPICKKKIEKPALDHDHQKIGGTGLCRGVCCLTCNSLLGRLENSCTRFLIDKDDLPRVLINISKYLKWPQTNYFHPTEFKKITDEEYDLIKKYYFIMNPRKRVLPNFPKTGLFNKNLKKILKDINRFIKDENKSKGKSGRVNKNSTSGRNKRK